jgi:hypothetical protein
MNTATTLFLMVLLIGIDILCFTKFKDHFTYEIEEYLLIDESTGKILKRLTPEEAEQLSKKL